MLPDLFTDEMTPATAWDSWAVAGVFVVMLPVWVSIPVLMLVTAYLWTRSAEDPRMPEALP